MLSRFGLSLLVSLLGFSLVLVESRLIPEKKLASRLDESLAYLWPLPKEFRRGNETLSVNPNLEVSIQGSGANSSILAEALERYRGIVFRHRTRSSGRPTFDLSKLAIVVDSDDEKVN